LKKEILNTEIQEFINSNLKSDITTLLLKGISFNNIDTKTIIEQIEAKKRSEKKLPTWFSSSNIYFPNKLNIEQTSSEITAKYKANLVSGESLIDLTGGFGVDSYYFSKQIDNITYCEINSKLSEIVRHNHEALNVSNIKCLNDNGIDLLKKTNQSFDWIYIDPSRRDDSKQKVFLLSDCKPNIKTFQDLFLKHSKHVMIKTSPLLDLSATLADLKNVIAIHIIAVNNEVKELLWVLERDFVGEVDVKTINIRKENIQDFEFKFKEEALAVVEYCDPLTYLYEPNAAILKAGAFNSMSQQLKLNKLHKHSHLYTADKLVNFPGRSFKIDKQIPFNKKSFAKEKIFKANITTRNFPISVHDIRKKLKVKDGGIIYLFFTTNKNEEKIILICSKAEYNL